ncbi:MAG: hypothetical protein V4621_08310 [Pseudomonadota bacterium]
MADFVKMYFPHYPFYAHHFIQMAILDQDRRMMSQKEFQNAVLNQQPDQEAATAASTGWIPVKLANTKWHYFAEGATVSACGFYTAEDVEGAEFYDGGHNSSDNCALCRARRESYLSNNAQNA